MKEWNKIDNQLILPLSKYIAGTKQNGQKKSKHRAQSNTEKRRKNVAILSYQIDNKTGINFMIFILIFKKNWL